MLPVLVSLGMVERREAPPSALFRLVPDHVAARLVVALSRARELVLDELGRGAAKVSPVPVSVIFFGSLARGDADAGTPASSAAMMNGAQEHVRVRGRVSDAARAPFLLLLERSSQFLRHAQHRR